MKNIIIYELLSVDIIIITIGTIYYIYSTIYYIIHL